MSESVGIDSFWGRAMPKAYSGDLREPVIEAVVSGASRREVAELFEVAVSTAVKWLQRVRDTGSSAAKPRGGSTSRLEKHTGLILGLVDQRPDATLIEIRAALASGEFAPVGAPCGGSWTVITSPARKKACGPRNSIARTWRGHAGSGDLSLLFLA
jgi:transposase-like protein